MGFDPKTCRVQGLLDLDDIQGRLTEWNYKHIKQTHYENKNNNYAFSSITITQRGKNGTKNVKPWITI